MLGRFSAGLKKTRQAITEKAAGMKALLGGNRRLDDATLLELEEALILADVGAAAASDIVKELRNSGDRQPPRAALAEIIAGRFSYMAGSADNIRSTPKVILVVGVNGSGKTTTIAKLARNEIEAGGKVILAAADTFRAAAVEQLEHWGNVVGAEIIKQVSGSDPAAVAFDAVNAGISRKASMVIIDTAGRLQTKSNLMEELKKIKRVVAKALEGAPHEVLIVMDATTGQNGLSQIALFDEAIGLTGIVVTKLDGTSKGGVLVAAAEKFHIPIKYIGIGEKPDDLLEFEARAFARALVGDDE